MTVVKHWQRLPRELVESPLLEIFKIQLNTVLRNLLQVALLWIQGLDKIISGVFQPQSFHDFVVL